ncbi:hypothetical protein LA733_0524 [Leptospira interrogans]|nr:hypothetical protein LA733_0524 [Leptospira interrogans]KWV28868.1 hypothetical protein LA702_0464 [Leptospira interrogans]
MFISLHACVTDSETDMFILPFFHKFKILDVSKKSSSLRILEINITPTNIFFRVYSLFQNL